MNEHDLILLATKHGSWFGNTLELRKEGLVALANDIANTEWLDGYEKGQKDGYAKANIDAVDRGEMKW